MKLKMIIVSQDRDVILNFDNVENIWMNNPLEKDNGKFEIRAESYSNNMFIGEYETEERAKEVLQEIVQKYSSYLQLNGGLAIMQGQMDIQPNIFNIPKIYEMPKE